MLFEAGWNDFLIEKGVRDPLALWRVGGRMISELLPPYTTVVTNRPARYFSMYAWAIHYLNQEGLFEDKAAFWERFRRLEACLLCAVASHGQHAYPGFGGSIGRKASSKLLREAQDGALDLSSFNKIANGWQSNYMKSMQQLGLLDVVPGVTSGMRLTSAGAELANAYGAAIEDTEFCRKHLMSDRVPLLAIQELASVGCACLLHAPSTEALLNERRCCVQHLLLQPNEAAAAPESPDELAGSMHLLIDVLKAADDIGEPLDLTRWRRVLSTGRLTPAVEYEPPLELETTFTKWRMYNADALLVYSLEAALAGFLEALHEHGVQGIKGAELLSELFTKPLAGAIKMGSELQVFASGSPQECIDRVSCLHPRDRHALEVRLVQGLCDSNGAHRVARAYLLFLYVRGIFKAFETDSSNCEALEFYRGSAQRDGHEFSLLHLAHHPVESHGLLEYFMEHFLKKWVINRQLSTREARGKEQAWFGYVSETDTYEWESDYHPHLYRAARGGIFMSLLLSLGLLNSHGDDGPGWSPDRQALNAAGL